VGVSVVNALSEHLWLTIYRNNREYQQEYRLGDPLFPLREVGPSDLRGTKIRFQPSPGTFHNIEFQYEILAKRLRELAFLNSGVKITLEDSASRSTPSRSSWPCNGPMATRNPFFASPTTFRKRTAGRI
jgi:DNA gyrase subunit B